MRSLILGGLLACASFVGLVPDAHAYQEQSLCQYINVASNTDEERYIPVPFAGTWQVTKAKFAPATAVSTDGTNYITVTLYSNAGTANTTWSSLASFNTNTGNTALVIGTTLNLSLTASAATVSEGYQFKFATAKTGSGAATDGQLCIVLRKVG